jgi:hypothetical protein
MVPNVSFFKFENLTLKNSKFQGVFPPITIFQGKWKLFLLLKCSHQKRFENLFFFNFKFPGKKE